MVNRSAREVQDFSATLFEEKLIAVVGLYLNPPEKALVLSVNEKSQIQALDGTQLGLSIVRGRCGTMTHDYKRAELIKAVLDYVAQHNEDPKPFIWRKTAQEIIEKVGRARLALHSVPTA